MRQALDRHARALRELLSNQQPEPQAEVVWCDDDGVTCRRWNWRQGRRTQLREDTTAGLFILDALGPMTDEALEAAADDLIARLTGRGTGVRAARRLIAPDATLLYRRWVRAAAACAG